MTLMVFVSVALAGDSSPSVRAATYPPICQQTLQEAKKSQVVKGTRKSDKLVGTNRADVIIGLGGNDKIKARGGDDFICGDDGDDKIVAGNGDDEAWLGAGADQFIGGAGNDLVYDVDGSGCFSAGPSFPDVFYGGDGIDGFVGSDCASRPPALDQAFGDAGDDQLFHTRVAEGGAGNDSIADCEACFGGLGNDVLLSVWHEAWGDEGNDIVELVGSFAHPPGSAVAHGGPGDDELESRMGGRLEGEDGSDVLDATVRGGSSNEFDALEITGTELLGGGNNDSLTGGIRNDYLDGGAGADGLDGGYVPSFFPPDYDVCDGGVDSDPDGASNCEDLRNIP